MKQPKPNKIVAVFLLSLTTVALSQTQVTPIADSVKERSDVYSLPPLEMLRPASLGYASAFADMIWAHILVTQGIRMAEGRPFDHVEQYLDSVITLDPAFREPYRLAESLLAFQRNDPQPDKSIRAARRIIEQGLKEFPYDARLWMDYGEFLAYGGATSLTDPKEKARWRVEGARALVRAGELGGKDENIYWHSISAVSILSKEGDRDGMFRFLGRIYAMTDDPELKEFLEKRMELMSEAKRESREMALARAFRDLWTRTYPFITPTQLRIVGPLVSTWHCAGADPSPQCDRNWSAWFQSQPTALPGQPH